MPGMGHCRHRGALRFAAPAGAAGAMPLPTACGRHGARSTAAYKVRKPLAAQLRVLLGAAALAGLALATCGLGAEIRLVGSQGCLDQLPGPPTNLKASPKDGKVVLTWSAPESGACVDTYVVNMQDPTFRSSLPAQTTATGANTVTVGNLQNGRTYLFTVQAYSSKYLGGGTAQVLSQPSDRCLDLSPGKPINMRVQPGDSMARLCWDGVDNDACVDEYRVSATPVGGPSFRSSADNKISRGGCANISSLQNDMQYQFTVVPFSSKRGEGTAGSINAYVGAQAMGRNGWQCKPTAGCHPSRPGLCSRGGCAAVARLGQCRAPAMYDADWTGRQITQWCGGECGCDLSVAGPVGGLGGFGGGGLGGGGLGGTGLGGGRASGDLMWGSFMSGNDATTSSGVGSEPAGGLGLQGLPSLQGLQGGGGIGGIGGGSASAPGSGGMLQSLVGGLVNQNVISDVAGKMAGDMVSRSVDAYMQQLFAQGG